jgi:ComF family protein
MLSFWLPLDCLVCGLPPHQLCRNCESALPLRWRSVSRQGLTSGLSCADYADPLAGLIRSFKADGSVRLARLFGRQLALLYADWLRARPPKEISQVLLASAPSRRAATRRRGFVPAHLIAVETARQLRALGISARALAPFQLGAGVRDQIGLSAQERLLNVENRVELKDSALAQLKQGRVVLIDDIITTGATLSAMQNCLLEAGVRPEIFLTFAETL